jgi:TPR repeat protein
MLSGLPWREDKDQPAEKVRWYRLAADKGHAVAQCNLGNCYEFGGGVPKCEEDAVGWYWLAAGQGHARAQCNPVYATMSVMATLKMRRKLYVGTS